VDAKSVPRKLFKKRALQKGGFLVLSVSLGGASAHSPDAVLGLATFTLGAVHAADVVGAVLVGYPEPSLKASTRPPRCKMGEAALWESAASKLPVSLAVWKAANETATVYSIIEATGLFELLYVTEQKDASRAAGACSDRSA
jgi:hypothetical protein